MEIEKFLHEMSESLVNQIGLSTKDDVNLKKAKSENITRMIGELERDPRSREKIFSDVSSQFNNRGEEDKENTNLTNLLMIPEGTSDLTKQSNPIAIKKDNPPPVIKKATKLASSEYEEYLESVQYLESILKYQEQLYNDYLEEIDAIEKEKAENQKYIDETLTKIDKVDNDLEEMIEESNTELNKTLENYRNLTDEKNSLTLILQEKQDILEKYDRECSFLQNKTSEKEKENQRLLAQIKDVEQGIQEKEGYYQGLCQKYSNLEMYALDISQQMKDNLEKKKILNNELQELKGNIRVYCRVRPYLSSDSPEEMDENLFNINDSWTLNLNVPNKMFKSENNVKEHKFHFEHIFTQKAQQCDVFNELSQLIQSALDGYNVCIFAYGQTGSGKTFTMEGDGTEENKGIIPRSVELIFQQIKYLKSYSWEYQVSVSFQEIYIDQIRDLLTNKPAPNGEISQITVGSPEAVYPLLKRAADNRKVAETNCNEHSSRSHSIFQLMLNGKNLQGKQEVKGTLNLIDLAGSERLSISKAEGERLKETQSINKSLTALGDVITALANKEKHIPYRNSKLTYTLQNYLGGDSKTLMFVNISPIVSNFNLTLCSLRFADKVKNCKIGVAKKHMKNI